MFKRIPRRCSWWGVHSPHETPTGFFDTATCDGVAIGIPSANLWAPMKNNELRKQYGLKPEPHKCKLKLTKQLMLSDGTNLYPENICWICHDCGKSASMQRDAFREMLTGPDKFVMLPGGMTIRVSHWR